MLKRFCFIFSGIVLTFINFGVLAQQDPKTVDYIMKYKNLALQHEKEYKIPACITLAQGILESASGTSLLAREANNHFGIKCHNWEGEKFYKDDDKKNDCFRVYPSVEESFKDHSLFLKKKRYADLFELEITDYKGWAEGLKQAGYATNPKHPQLLTDLIERYNLQDLSHYDTLGNNSEQIALNDEQTEESQEQNQDIEVVEQEDISKHSHHRHHHHGFNPHRRPYGRYTLSEYWAERCTGASFIKPARYRKTLFGKR